MISETISRTLSSRMESSSVTATYPPVLPRKHPEEDISLRFRIRIKTGPSDVPRRGLDDRVSRRGHWQGFANGAAERIETSPPLALAGKQPVSIRAEREKGCTIHAKPNPLILQKIVV